jgi:glycosyltransferase involved in cell wall biosynthesis
MKILFLADGRSPTARSWLAAVLSGGHEVHLLSTYPCETIPGLASQAFLPLAFSGVGRKQQDLPGGKQSNKSRLGRVISRFRKAFLRLRYYLGPLSLPLAAAKYRAIVRRIQPDVVHALRIPYEGMLAGYTPRGYTVAVSSWGNDFTLHARESLLMYLATRASVRRADGFTADCQRDLRLARQWGLRADAPAVFVPGSGGLDVSTLAGLRQKQVVSAPVIINPRGIRPAYVMNDQFFKALPAVLREFPDAIIYCAAMSGELDAEKWMKALKLPTENVKLLSPMPQADLWRIASQARVVVSPATHDGTPNSVLECMALGCLPVVGNIEPLREWITDEENGILVDPNDPASIAAGLMRALRDDALAARAAEMNWQVVKTRADKQITWPVLLDFYQKLKS